MTLLNSNR